MKSFLSGTGIEIESDSDSEEPDKPQDASAKPGEEGKTSAKKETRGRKKKLDGTPKPKVPKEPKIKAEKPPKEKKLSKYEKAARTKYVSSITSQVIRLSDLDQDLKNLFLADVENIMKPYMDILFKDIVKKRRKSEKKEKKSAEEKNDACLENDIKIESITVTKADETASQLSHHQGTQMDVENSNSFSQFPTESQATFGASTSLLNPNIDENTISESFKDSYTTGKDSYFSQPQAMITTPTSRIENSNSSFETSGLTQNSFSTRETTNISFESLGHNMTDTQASPENDKIARQISSDLQVTTDTAMTFVTPSSKAQDCYPLATGKTTQNQAISHEENSSTMMKNEEDEESKKQHLPINEEEKGEINAEKILPENPYKDFIQEINKENSKSLVTNGVKFELYTSEEAWKNSSAHTKNMLFSFVTFMKDIFEEKLRNWTMIRNYLLKKLECSEKLLEDETFSEYLKPCKDVL
mgnify:FL=1